MSNSKLPTEDNYVIIYLGENYDNARNLFNGNSNIINHHSDCIYFDKQKARKIQF